MPSRLISIVTNCWNEVENIPLFYSRCNAELAKHPDYEYEFIVEDNCSTDGTRELLREIAAKDPKFKVILNSGNFGHIRSPHNALLNASGDVVFFLSSDLQDPPEMLTSFLEKYHEGFQIVAGVRAGTKANLLLEIFRRCYYALLRKSAPGQKIISRFTGFGLYGRCVIEALKKFHDSYPYMRGLICEIGFKLAEVPYVQEKRKHGISKNNFFTLYDLAMTGFVNHTKLPLRLAVLTGFVIGIFSFLIALIYFALKLCFWNTFQLGLAPLVIGMFFLSAIQLIFIGVLGEYLGAVWTQVRNKPLVIEEERINFD